MSSYPAELPEVYRGAFDIFRRELAEHVEKLSAALDSTAHEAAPPPLLKELVHRFHLLKGSAGFLKLGELQKKSAQAEALAKSLAQTGEASHGLSDTLRTVLDECRELLNTYGS